VVDLNRYLRKQAKKSNFITPRDFLDFIGHYIAITKDKSEKLEEQQVHLNVGLDKLKEMEELVLQLQILLNSKKLELE